MKKIIFTIIIGFIIALTLGPVLAGEIDIPTKAADSSKVAEECPIGVLCLNVPIGGLKTVSGLDQYIRLWFDFVVGVVGILATVIIMWGGFKWLTSRGNAAAIGDAKDRIWSAIIGLILVFLSVTLLNIINPELITPKLPDLPVKQINISRLDNNLPADYIIRDGITYGTHPIFGTPTIFVAPNATPSQLANAQTECQNLCTGQGYGTGNIGGNRNQGFTCQCDITSGITVSLPSDDPLYILASNPEQLGLSFNRNNLDEIAISWSKPLTDDRINSMIQLFEINGYEVSDNRTATMPHIAVNRTGGIIINQ